MSTLQAVLPVVVQAIASMMRPLEHRLVCSAQTGLEYPSQVHQSLPIRR